jgi:homoserine O-succinyltransferase
MPIRIPSGLPGRAILEKERVPLILEERAIRQDIRPLQIALLNLMPDKIKTETQILRVLGATPLQVEVTLLHMASHTSKNTSSEHLAAFYRTTDDIADRRFDALIVTGAPIEHLPYEEVTYWNDLRRIFDWADRNVYSQMYICWGAMAALYHYHGIPKHMMPAKKSGVYQQRVLDNFDPLVTGFDDFFGGPVSRLTEVRRADIEKHGGPKILVEAEDGDPAILHDEKSRRVYILNHLEYDAETLKNEYDRDVKAGANPNIPLNYYPGNDPAAEPKITWRAHRNILFNNWINIVYQGTPYDLAELDQLAAGRAA